MKQSDQFMDAHASAARPIDTSPRLTCYVCGSPGDITYKNLRDRIFNVEGHWSLRRCSNQVCKLLWLDPMPIDSDLPRLYAEYYTHFESRNHRFLTWLRETIKHAYWSARYGYPGANAMQRAVVGRLVQLLPGAGAQLALQVFELSAHKDGRLLEIGCGNGSALCRMADLGWRVEGVDFDVKAVQFARSRGLNVRLGGVEQQGYDADTYDAVVMTHVLEHVPDPRALLRECHRILKPGGCLVCITPNSLSWCHERYRDNWLHLDPPRHLHIFNMAALRHIACELSWATVEMSSTTANTHGTERGSKHIKCEGHFDMSSRPTLYEQCINRAIQFYVSLRLWRFHEIGDELVLRTIK